MGSPVRWGLGGEVAEIQKHKSSGKENTEWSCEDQGRREEALFTEGLSHQKLLGSLFHLSFLVIVCITYVYPHLHVKKQKVRESRD